MQITKKQLSRIRTWQQVSKVITGISEAETLVNFASTKGLTILNQGFLDFCSLGELTKQRDLVTNTITSLKSETFVCILHWCIVNIGNNLEKVLLAGAFEPSVVLSMALLYRKLCFSTEPNIEASMIEIMKSRQFRCGEYELLKQMIRQIKCTTERNQRYAGILLGFIYEAFAFVCEEYKLSLVVRD